MSQVEFTDEKRMGFRPENPKKDTKNRDTVLVTVSVIILLLSFYIVYHYYSKAKPKIFQNPDAAIQP